MWTTLPSPDLQHGLHPVVSRNSMTTESADAQCVGVPVLGAISDRACVLSDSEAGQVNVMKLNCCEPLGGASLLLPGSGMKSTISISGHYFVGGSGGWEVVSVLLSPRS